MSKHVQVVLWLVNLTILDKIVYLVVKLIVLALHSNDRQMTRIQVE